MRRDICPIESMRPLSLQSQQLGQKSVPSLQSINYIVITVVAEDAVTDNTLV